MFAFNNRAVECFFWSKCVWEVEATFACANIASSLESLVKNCLTLYRRVRKQTNMNLVLLFFFLHWLDLQNTIDGIMMISFPRIVF